MYKLLAGCSILKQSILSCGHVVWQFVCLSNPFFGTKRQSFGKIFMYSLLDAASLIWLITESSLNINKHERYPNFAYK